MVLVTVKQGVLEGESVENQYGGRFYSFKGIPYARPPVGDLRFTAPKSPEPWTGVRSAKEHGPICYQNDVFFNDKNIGSEDCLYLNIYTPNIKPDKPLPVMFYIHGGAFMSGSGNEETYGPEFLVKRDVILITINYRLYLLGFLCLDTKTIPGNAGMKDQVAAMRWVKENISHFGGDPENITIFGESAGAASVSWHLISPMTKGLFKRAIIQSGSARSYWARTFEPRERAIAIARKCGMYSENDSELADFFKSLPLETLLEPSIPITLAEKAFNIMDIKYAIVSEKDFGEERFFYGDLFEALRNAIHERVEIMSGYCEHEGIVKIKGSSIDNLVLYFNQFRELFVPREIAMNIPLNEQFKVGKLVKKYYYGDEDVTKENLHPLIRYFSSEVFIYDMVQFQRYCVKAKNKTYLYKFTCKSRRNLFKRLCISDPSVELGQVTSHADDVAYIFPIKLFGQRIDEDSEEYKMIENVVTLWTNFAKYGNPTPDNSLGIKWAPYTLDEQEYLDIGENLVPGNTPDKEDYEIFDNLFKKYMPDVIV